MRKIANLCVLILVLPIFIRAEDPGRIQGQVRRAGKPVGGVDVILVELSLTVITNKEGVYLFSRIPPGTYTLVYTQGDNTVTKEGIVVSAGKMTKYDVDVEWQPLLTHDVTVYAASRRTERIADAPAAVSVVEEAEIEREAAHGQLPRILETAPGIDSAQSGVFDFSVNTRGFNDFGSRRVFTIVDGMDFSTIVGGAQEWDIYSMYLPALASMELIRGPGSALYGANAFNGVLSINTKSSRYSQGGNIRLSVGEMSMGLLDLRYAGDLGKDWYFGFAGSYMETKDYTVSRNVSVEYEGLPIDAIPVPLEKNKRLSGGIRFDKHFASGSVLTLETSASNYKGRTTLHSGGRTTYLNSPAFISRINFKSPHWNILVHGGFGDWEGISLGSGVPMFAYWYRLRGEVQGFTDFAGGKGRIVGGFSLQREGTDTANDQGIQTFLSPVVRYDKGAVFGQLDYKFIDKLKAILASRVDFSTLHKTQFSPKVSVVYTFNPGHTLRLSYNQAFLSPNMMHFFMYWQVAPPVDLSPIEDALTEYYGRDLGLGFSNIPVLTLGNENLIVEEITSYEIGYSNIFGQKLLFNINYYRNQLKNFITDWLPFVNPDYGPYSPPSDLPDEIQTATLNALEQVLPPEYYALMSNSLENGSAIFAVASVSNSGRIDAQGIELGLKYFFNTNLSAYINYAWFDSEVKEEFIGFTKTPNTPEHRIGFGASYISDRLDISLRYRWVDDFLWASGIFRGMVNSYNLFDLTSNIYFANGFSIGLNIFNLFNVKHYQCFGGDMLHRNIVATFGYRW